MEDEEFLDWLNDPTPYLNESERVLGRLQPAWAKAALALRGGDRFGHSGRRFLSWIAVHETLELHRRRFEQGDTLELLLAVKTCATENVPLPTWLAMGFTKALDSFTRAAGEALSLDTAFASPTLPTDTPKKAATARQDWLLAAQIMMAVSEEARKDEALCSLDAAIAKVLQTCEFGVRKTKARELFNMAEKNQIEHLRANGINMQPLSRLFAKRRKDATR